MCAGVYELVYRYVNGFFFLAQSTIDAGVLVLSHMVYHSARLLLLRYKHDGLDLATSMGGAFPIPIAGGSGAARRRGPNSGTRAGRAGA